MPVSRYPPSQAIKIRFIKNKKYEELYHDDEKVLETWYHYLAGICIYSNFRSDYEIHTMLGKGNFAKVYLVEEKKTGKKFAAKIFDKSPIKNDEFEKVSSVYKKCFLFEIEMLREVKTLICLPRIRSTKEKTTSIA